MQVIYYNHLHQLKALLVISSAFAKKTPHPTWHYICYFNLRPLSSLIPNYNLFLFYPSLQYAPSPTSTCFILPIIAICIFSYFNMLHFTHHRNMHLLLLQHASFYPSSQYAFSLTSTCFILNKQKNLLHPTIVSRSTQAIYQTLCFLHHVGFTPLSIVSCNHTDHTCCYVIIKLAKQY